MRTFRGFPARYFSRNHHPGKHNLAKQLPRNLEERGYRENHTSNVPAGAKRYTSSGNGANRTNRQYTISFTLRCCQRFFVNEELSRGWKECVKGRQPAKLSLVHRLHRQKARILYRNVPDSSLFSKQGVIEREKECAEINRGTHHCSFCDLLSQHK